MQGLGGPGEAGLAGHGMKGAELGVCDSHDLYQHIETSDLTYDRLRLPYIGNKVFSPRI